MLGPKKAVTLVLATLAVAAGIFWLGHRTAAAPVSRRSEQPPSAKEALDANLTKTANDQSLLPEVRVDALASRAKVEALSALDARLGTKETQIFAQQESEHWQRVIEALDHPRPKHDTPERMAWRQGADQAFDKMANDPNAASETRADVLASRNKFDALFDLDRLLGTAETDIFFRQEVDRSGRVLDAMKALKK